MTTEQAKRLLAAIGDLGTGDIYTDSWEYSTRVSKMIELCALADRGDKGFTEDELSAALEMPDAADDESPEDDDDAECDCDDRSWYGPEHDDDCPLTGSRDADRTHSIGGPDDPDGRHYQIESEGK